MTYEKAVMNMCALIRFALAASVLIVLTVALDCRPVLASEILLLRYHGVINPVSAQYLETGLEKARKDQALAVVLELDTPGGLDLSMRSMVKAMLASPIPVIVFVAPPGSRAASAGGFLVYASSLAAMAPGTNLGAAHPVTLEGPAPGKTMQKKMENDAAAYIGSIATKRGRNAQWAMEAVRKSVSIGAEDALKKGVIDLVAPDLPALMTSLDGRTVPTGSGTVTLHLTSARVREYPLSVGLKALRILSEPQVAFLLMTLGFWGIVFELSQPGMVVPGVVGVMSLALAFYAFQTLPFHWAGILLILLGFVFLLLEVKIPSYGVLTSGGLLSMIRVTRTVVPFGIGGASATACQSSPYIRTSPSGFRSVRATAGSSSIASGPVREGSEKVFHPWRTTRARKTAVTRAVPMMTGAGIRK